MNEEETKSEEEMMEMIQRSPDAFIKYIENHNLNFNKIGAELDFGRKVVQKRFNMSKEQINTVEFAFWFTYYVESEVQDMIVFPETQLGARKEVIESFVDKLPFGSKIAVLHDIYYEHPKTDPLVSFLWKVNKLRNDLAHGRFEKLKYGGYPLSDVRGQIKITAEFMNILKKKDL